MLPKVLLIFEETSLFGWFCLPSTLPSYHQNFIGTMPSRAGNSKRRREFSGYVSLLIVEKSSASMTVG